MDNTPAGHGRRGFRRLDAACARDGKLYFQAGKTGFWNMRGRGPGHGQKPWQRLSVSISPGDVVKAATGSRGATSGGSRQRNAWPSGERRMASTGNFDRDFSGAEVIRFQKQDDAQVRAAAAWDDAEPVPGLGRPRPNPVAQQGHRTRADVHRRRHGRFPAWHRSRGRQEAGRGSPRRPAAFDRQLPGPSHRGDLSPPVGREEAQGLQLRRGQGAIAWITSTWCRRPRST